MSVVPRCCEGSTYTLPEDIGVWQIVCAACHRLLHRVRASSEEEVYADL